MGDSEGTGPLGQSVKDSVTSVLKGHMDFKALTGSVLKVYRRRQRAPLLLPLAHLSTPHGAPSHSPLPYTHLIN